MRGIKEMLHRELPIDQRSIDEDARTVVLSFSSEAEVERYFGIEVLDHSERAVRLGRLRGGAPLLLNHDRGDQVGVVEEVQIDGDRRGRATVRFGRGQRASEIFQDVVDGIRRLVSVGYRVHGTEIEKRKGELDLVRVTDWEPFELSLVSIPADESVGVGRDESIDPTPNKSTSKEMKNQDEAQASKDAERSKTDGQDAPELTTETRAADEAKGESKRESVTVIREAPSGPSAAEAVAAERKRVSEIRQIAEQAERSGARINATRAIDEGISSHAFQRQAFDAMVSSNVDYQPGAPSLSRTEQRDVGRFDLGTAIRSMIHGGSRLDGVEAEMIAEGQREMQRAGIGGNSGISLPSFLVRDMSATGGTNGDEGGNTVATVKRGLLDDFFNNSVIRQLGATVLTGLTSNVDIPRLVADDDPAGKAENAGADEVSPETAMLSLTPKRLPAFIDLSDQLLMQSSAAIESMIRMHLTNQLLAVQEAAFFHGTGTNEANGIAADANIGSVVGGTNGAAPTYDHMVELEEKVAGNNALAGSLNYVSNSQIRKKLKTTPMQASGVEGNFILGQDNDVNGYNFAVTNAVSRTLDKGSSTGVASAIFFGNFRDYIVGYWGGLNLKLIQDSTNGKLGMHTLIANTYYDGGVARPKSFAAMLDALGA